MKKAPTRRGGKVEGEGQIRKAATVTLVTAE
jgi:hypothetical protein